MARQATSAVEIDNEMLCDQVSTVRESIKWYKERKEATRKELARGRQGVERVGKGKEKARTRTEELGEALHENTIALENARVEVEMLRNEIEVRFCHASGSRGPRSSCREQSTVQLAPLQSAQCAKLQEEISLAQAGSEVQALEEELRFLQDDRETVGLSGFFSQVLTHHSLFSAARVAQAYASRTRGQACGATRLDERAHHRVGYPLQEAQPSPSTFSLDDIQALHR